MVNFSFFSQLVKVLPNGFNFTNKVIHETEMQKNSFTSKTKLC
jgi:hypothetical protein